jgi:hypothetical protein
MGRKALVLAVLLFQPALAHAEDAAAPPTVESSGFPKNRYTYVAGSVFLLAGLGAGYVAQGDAARAQSVSSAADARGAIADARFASSTASVLYVLAGVTLAYGLLFEFLPRDVLDRATLTFHF